MRGLLGRLGRDLRTARHIPADQLAARARFIALRGLYRVAPRLPLPRAAAKAAGATARADLPTFPPAVLRAAATKQRATDILDGRFTHLGVTREYGARIDWRDATVSPLWAYQMQYLGAVVDLALSGRPAAAAAHLASWRAAFAHRWDAVAWHPYPTSLRLVNLCLAACAIGSFEALGDDVVGVVATHARYLEDHMERDVRGNHLLENAVALVTAARCVDGAVDDGGHAALALLRAEIAEQVLPDGTHFERAPMYHAIVLGRLRLLQHVLADRATREVVREAARRMARRLSWLLCPDGDLPLLGDSARGFAPSPADLFGSDDEVGPAPPGVSSATDAGLHVLRDGPLWCVFDTGPVCPPYLPAHGQADALTVEVWIGGSCLVTDPGLHEYTGPERAWGRSSRAHSTITVDDRDSSEVYGRFRVGGREQMERVVPAPRAVQATLRPWGVDARLTRTVALAGDAVLRLTDAATAPARSVVRSRLHLHPDVEVLAGAGTPELHLRVGGRRVTIRATGTLLLEPGRCSLHFGEIRATQIAVLVLERDAAGVARGVIDIVPEPGA